jgi:predicted small secreted protein
VGTVNTDKIGEGDHMRTMLAAILLALMGLAGCNTVEGVGKDIERGGEQLQDSAEKRR